MPHRSSFSPPEPGKWMASDHQARSTRKEAEKDCGGFDWTDAIGLALLGAGLFFSVERNLDKFEKKREKPKERPRDRDRDRDRDYASSSASQRGSHGDRSGRRHSTW